MLFDICNIWAANLPYVNISYSISTYFFYHLYVRHSTSHRDKKVNKIVKDPAFIKIPL